MKPKLIIFDFFGTLGFSAQKLKNEEFFAFYKKVGIKLDTKEDIKSFLDIFSRLIGYTENWQDFSEKLLEKTVGKVNRKTIDKLANFYKENLIYQVYDDVREIIELPCKKAILTTCSKFMLPNLVLEKSFEIFTPKETKFLKPNPKAFWQVLNYFKLKPEDSLMIGDEIERDLIPAEKIGFKTILIDRKNSIEDYSSLKIKSLKELKGVLKKL